MQNKSVPAKKIHIVSCAADKRKNPQTYYYRLFCKSCVKCQQRKGWKGYALYKSGQMTITGNSVDAHGDFDYRYGSRTNALTSQQKHHVENYLTEHSGEYRIQQVLQSFHRAKEPVPQEAAVRNFIRNLKERHKEAML